MSHTGREVWVFVEQRGGKPAEVSFELLSKGRKLADAMGGVLKSVVIGDDVRGIAAETFEYGADEALAGDSRYAIDLYRLRGEIQLALADFDDGGALVEGVEQPVDPAGGIGAEWNARQPVGGQVRLDVAPALAAFRLAPPGRPHKAAQQVHVHPALLDLHEQFG